MTAGALIVLFKWLEALLSDITLDGYLGFHHPPAHYFQFLIFSPISIIGPNLKAKIERNFNGKRLINGRDWLSRFWITPIKQKMAIERSFNQF